MWAAVQFTANSSAGVCINIAPDACSVRSPATHSCLSVIMSQFFLDACRFEMRPLRPIPPPSTFLLWNLAKSTTISTSGCKHEPALEVCGLCRIVHTEFDLVMGRGYYWYSGTWFKLVSSPRQCLPPFRMGLSLESSEWLVTKQYVLQMVQRPYRQAKYSEGEIL
jgi:hypothetical protein